MESRGGGNRQLKGQYLQARDHPKLANFAGSDAIAVVQPGNPDQQIGGRDNQGCLLHLGVDLGRKHAYLTREGLDRQDR